MVVSDEVILIVLLTLIDFALIYKKNKFAGNVLLMLIGGGVLYVSSIRHIEAVFVGTLIILFAIVNLIVDLMSKDKSEG